MRPLTLAIASGFVLASLIREKNLNPWENPARAVAEEYGRRLRKIYAWKFRLGNMLKFLTPHLYGKMAKGLNARLLWQPLAHLACQTPVLDR